MQVLLLQLVDLRGRHLATIGTQFAIGLGANRKRCRLGRGRKQHRKQLFFQHGEPPFRSSRRGKVPSDSQKKLPKPTRCCSCRRPAWVFRAAPAVLPVSSKLALRCRNPTMSAVGKPAGFANLLLVARKRLPPLPSFLLWWPAPPAFFTGCTVDLARRGTFLVALERGVDPAQDGFDGNTGIPRGLDQCPIRGEKNRMEPRRCWKCSSFR